MSSTTISKDQVTALFKRIDEWFDSYDDKDYPEQSLNEDAADLLKDLENALKDILEGP